MRIYFLRTTGGSAIAPRPSTPGFAPVGSLICGFLTSALPLHPLGDAECRLVNVFPAVGQADQQMRDAPLVSCLRQFSDVDNAGFLLLADAKMDVISHFEAID
jgi:hypothetical protein